jgi:hypothetical protein
LLPTRDEEEEKICKL